MTRKALPLARYPSCHSRDLEEAGALVTKEFGLNPIRAAQRSSRADVRINCLYLPRMHLTYVQYGAAIDVHPAHPTDHYLLLLSLNGKVQSCTASESVVCSRGQAALTSPSILSSTRSNAESTRMNLAIYQETLDRCLAAFLGERPRTPLVFRRDVDLRRGPGRSLASFITWSIQEFDLDDDLLRNPLLLSQFEDWVLTALLTRQPHSFSEAFSEGDRRALPRDVKRTIDYIQAHADHPITVEDLVSVSGVPGRTLYRHFRDFTGYAPMAYLRKVRFERVREDLKRASPTESVTDLALKWGFRHSGRFSMAYRQSFGESPSQTLGKRRQR